MENRKEGVFTQYHPESHLYDEVFDSRGQIRPEYEQLIELFNTYNLENFQQLNDQAKTSFFNQGITFQVYSDKKAAEKIFPFDLFPRVISPEEWELLERGVIQRSRALNEFIADLYGERKILKQGIVPMDLIMTSKNFLHEMVGIEPPGGIYNHISGTDLIKHSDGQYYVLEDNIRCPSGVSYVVSNRLAMKRTLVGIFNKCHAASVTEYSDALLDMLQTVKPQGTDVPNIVVITPGMYNSAYYEHSYLAKAMGAELVEGRDLFVENDFVYMKTLHGPVKVDVVYRRIDDDFLDPLQFRDDSVLGVPGLYGAYRAGNVTLANAPGTGVADDKAVYIYMPEIIKYYLDEEPILNNVKSYRCGLEEDLKYVLEHVHELVVKPVDEAGGYGISVGNKLTKEEIEEVKIRIKANPRKYIAQPIMSLSTHATFIEDTNEFEPRHIDLRTFTLLGKDYEYVLKGGLTRVALRKGNLIVNSSQGGGSKDTWVLQ